MNIQTILNIFNSVKSSSSTLSVWFHNISMFLPIIGPYTALTTVGPSLVDLNRWCFDDRYTLIKQGVPTFIEYVDAAQLYIARAIIRTINCILHLIVLLIPFATMIISGPGSSNVLLIIATIFAICTALLCFASICDLVSSIRGLARSISALHSLFELKQVPPEIKQQLAAKLSLTSPRYV